MSSVRSRRAPRKSSLAAGFTLLEVQIATLIFVAAMVGMVGGARVYKKLLVSSEAANRVDGVALEDGQRTIATVTFVGDAHPECEVSLQSVAANAGSLEADVYVTRRAP